MPSVPRSEKELAARAALGDTDAKYEFTDQFLKQFIGLPSNELVTHLKNQMRATKTTKGGVASKTVAFIRTLIEQNGEDPDELLKQLEKDS